MVGRARRELARLGVWVGTIDLRRRLGRGEAGQAFAEYALIIALIALAGIAAASFLRHDISSFFSSILAG